MSSLYLKLAALGVTGVTVATVVPISVIKSSGNLSAEVEQQSNSGRADQEAPRAEDLDRQGETNRESNQEGLSVPSSSLPAASVQVASAKEAPKIDKCKDIASGSAGRLNMCYDEVNEEKVKFTFFQFLDGTTSVNSTHSVGDLTVTPSSNLKVVVKNFEDGGRKDGTVWLTLLSQAFNGSLILNANSFNQDQCSVEWITDSYKGVKTNWKVTCES